MSVYSSLILKESALVGYWQLDETSGTAAADSKGSATGTYLGTYTLNQASFAPAGRCVSFGGGNVGGFSVTAVLQPANVTVECWVKPSSVTDVRSFVCSNYYPGSGNIGYELGWNVTGGSANALGFGSLSAAWHNAQMSGSGVTLNAWNHVVGTYDGTALLLYLNGVQQASASWAGPLAYQSQPFAIGRQHSGNNLANCLMDEVAIYNAALSAAAINNHYLAYNPGVFRRPRSEMGARSGSRQRAA
jgi:hypothetical protein